MSERIRTTQAGNTAIEEQTSLNDLSASKDLHKQGGANTLHASANQSDFSEASISTTNILRVSPKVEQRRDLTNTTTAPSQSTTHETARSNSKASSQASNKEHGIFTNPAYKYSGGIFSRIISFIANLLKVLERLFLRLLGGGDRTTPTPRPQKNNTQAPATESQISGDDRKEREKKERAQAIHRS